MIRPGDLPLVNVMMIVLIWWRCIEWLKFLVHFHMWYKRQNSVVNEIILWPIWQKGIDWLIAKPKIFNYNFFSLIKVILTLIIFAPLVRNFAKCPTCTPCCQGLSNDSKSIARDLMVLRVLIMCDHKTKQISILILIYRCVDDNKLSYTFFIFQCKGWNNATPLLLLLF
jgi:hypothetical protein